MWCLNISDQGVVLPDLLHVIPVSDDTMLDRVFQGKDTSLALGFITYVGIFLTHANHDTLMTRSTNDRRKDLDIS